MIGSFPQFRTSAGDARESLRLGGLPIAVE